MLSILFMFLTVFIPYGYGEESQDSKYDTFGGWMAVSASPTRFFTVAEIDKVWWILDPAGNAFISKGVNHISYTADFCPPLGYSPYGRTTEKKYGSAEAWSIAAAENLRRWNFNTVGSWSDEGMRRQQIPYTLILNIAAKAGGDWQTGAFPDVFSDAFRRAAGNVARTECRKRSDDMYLIGYFTDNELHWGPDWRTKNSLLIDYLQFKPDAPGNRKAVEFLQQRYAALEEWNAAWTIQSHSFAIAASSLPLPESDARKRDEADFQRIVAEEYFRICRDAIKKADANHMILGCRFAGAAPEPVLEAAAKYVDIITFNTYNYLPPRNTLERIHAITKKPILITEFSFKAMDSGLPNTKGAGKPVETQDDRARHFTEFVTALMKMPFVVGYHWFEYADEPKEGRFDGENSNYGLVDINDKPWETLTSEMMRTNATVEAIHRGDARP
ncbi:MAG: beta-agarase [Candidatus Omnitrophota bacterium]|jgi:hypothetical protein|nr:MAG: beta-agarase [Candidatus Omnitrophota bacterium]